MRERYWHSGRTPANSLLALFLCGSMLGAQAQQQQAPSTPAPQQQQQQTPNAPTPQPAPSTMSPPGPLAIRTPPNLAMPHSRNPLDAYAPSTVAKPDLSNSKRLNQLIRDGRLHLAARRNR